MQEYFSEHLTAIILAAIAVLAGIVITVRVSKNSKNTNKDKSNRVTQSGNKVGGDQAGRDINNR